MNVSAGSSSGVVGGLMTGDPYQFSVSITVPGNGRTYTGSMSDPSDPITITELPCTCSEYIIREARGSASLCRVEWENKMAATYNVLAFKR